MRRFVEMLLLRLITPMLPIALAALLAICVPPPAIAPPAQISLDTVHLQSASALNNYFRQQNYQWPPQGNVPAVAVKQLPPDFADLPVPEKKSLFFRIMLPLVLAENARIRRSREFVEEAFHQGVDHLDREQQANLAAIAKRYRVAGDLTRSGNQAMLLRRVDTVPVALVLAQAANESGWGTSRFARQANNLFGIWTYKKDKGLTPRDRAPQARHFVRVFPDLRHAVRDYLRNINIGHAYRKLRLMRAEMRQQGKTMDASTLARGLHQYSERGQQYVDMIQAMIRTNDLGDLEPLELASVS
ncbi:MAG: glucosaminidase domain-containing protein [Gammaproteobacteria bacterium]|jgi:Bax protein